MARPKWVQWVEPENLERVVNWAANGNTIEEIAHNMGVHPSTLHKWMDAHGEIREAIKEGRGLAVEVVENALFRKATGQCVVRETVEEFRGELRDGKPCNGTVVRRTVERPVPPDTAAMIFYLKNRVPDRYSDRRTVDVEGVAPTVVLGVRPGRADG